MKIKIKDSIPKFYTDDGKDITDDFRCYGLELKYHVKKFPEAIIKCRLTEIEVDTVIKDNNLIIRWNDES